MKPSTAALVQLPLRAESYGHEPRELEARAQQFGRGERLRRAGRMAGILWLVGLLSVAVPLLHFVTVPSLLVAGFWMGAKLLRQERAIAAVAGPCPACGQHQQFKVSPEAQFPLIVNCPGCHAFVKLHDVG